MTADRWLTVNEIAERLKVSDQTVRRWLRSGALAGRNFGGKAGYRVREEDLQAFINRAPRPSALAERVDAAMGTITGLARTSSSAEPGWFPNEFAGGIEVHFMPPASQDAAPELMRARRALAKAGLKTEARGGNGKPYHLFVYPLVPSTGAQA